MKKSDVIPGKIYERKALVRKLAQERMLGKKVAFTNGCFDILHPGHIASLSQAAATADFLVVGINSDASTKKLKGEGRPINGEQSRALIMAALLAVDAVTIFDEDTPLDLIIAVEPDVLVKGGDYSLEQIVGAKEVIAYGGKVVINPIVEGYSTTGILEKIKSL